MNSTLDPAAPSMQLWRVLVADVGEERARELMNGYAHELADQMRSAEREPKPDDSNMIRAYINGWNAGRQAAADDIDPQTDE